jgi:hypothetical protein
MPYFAGMEVTDLQLAVMRLARAYAATEHLLASLDPEYRKHVGELPRAIEALAHQLRMGGAAHCRAVALPRAIEALAHQLRGEAAALSDSDFDRGRAIALVDVARRLEVLRFGGQLI